MNFPWWFKLYTLHTLKFFAKVTLVQLVLFLLCSQLGEYVSLFAGITLFIGPFLFFSKHESSHFRMNIEFHKMSVPFYQLKRAFFFDILIKQAVLSLTFLFNLYIAIQVCGGMKLAEGFMIITPSQFLYFLPVYFLCAVSTMTHYKETKYILFKKHRLEVVNFALFVFIIASGFSLFFVVVNFGYDVPSFISFGISALTIGSLIFRSKAIFHQFRAVGRIRDAFKFFSYGTAFCLTFYFIAVFVGREDVLDTSYSDVQRASSFDFSGPFAPEIDKESFVAIERHLEKEELKILYSKSDFPVGSLGIEYFLDNDPHLNRLRAMIEYSKPDEIILTALYDHFEKHPEYWKEKYGPLTFKEFAYSKWPAKSLPEKFALAKEDNLKAIDLKNEERRRNREIASKKRSR